MDILYLDTEARSPVDIKKHGLAQYCKGGVEVILLTYAYSLSGGRITPVKVWEPLRQQMPEDLKFRLKNKDCKIQAHNARFDRLVMSFDQNIRQTIKLPLHIDRFVCSMVQALEHQLPPGLDLLSKVLLTGDKRKLSADGKRLINLFCVPHKTKKEGTHYVNPEDRPDEWQKFIEYAVRDTQAMIDCIQRMPKFNYPGQEFYTHGIESAEYKSWLLDEKINDYGIRVDVPVIEKAVEAAEVYANTLKENISDLTDGAVTSPTQRDVFLDYMNDTFGLGLESCAKEVLIKTYVESTDNKVKELIAIRLLGSQSAASKFKKALDTNVDGVIRHTIQFAGASQTLRYAGRGFQPQNMKRPAYSEDIMDRARDFLLKDPEAFVRSTRSPALMLGSMVTGCILPRENHKLCVCDYSSVESRVIRWLSGDEKGLQFFRDYDAKRIKHDLYMVAYGNSFNIDYDEVTKPQRQIGKPIELSFGFGGGCGAFFNTVKGNFGQVTVLDDIDAYKSLEDLVEVVRVAATEADYETLQLSDASYDFALANGNDHGLTPLQFGGIEYLKRTWRRANHYIETWWGLLEEAFTNAMDIEGKLFRARKVSFMRKGDYLYMRLPSGKIITFMQPHRKVVKNKKSKQEEVKIVYKSVKDGHWTDVGIYGGKLAAIATQSTARELLVPKIPMVADAGYKLVFTKHDEIIAECFADDPVRGYEDLKRIMETPLDWCKDMPVVSSGYESAVRYRKD